MATPQERIESDVKAALKAGEKVRLSTLRMLLADIKNERIKRGAELDEEAFAGVLRRGIKQRRESIEQYRGGGRPELASKEEEEAGILASYLPQQATDEEVRAAIRQLIDAEGLNGPQAIGPVMRAMMARFAGRADGTTINRIARELLG